MQNGALNIYKTENNMFNNKVVQLHKVSYQQESRSFSVIMKFKMSRFGHLLTNLRIPCN